MGVFRLPAIGLLSFVALTGAAVAGNFEFLVPGGPGLDMRITGYGADGSEMFTEETGRVEMRDGKPFYVVRVDETIVRSQRLAEWCVEELTGRWDLARAPGVLICDDRPYETRGAYKFTSRLEKAAPAPQVPAEADPGLDEPPLIIPERSEKLLTACVQTELNLRNFNSGRPDGVMGNRTRGAASDYLAANPGVALPDLETDLAAWCDHLAIHEFELSRIETKGDIGLFEGKVEDLVEKAETTLSELFETNVRSPITFFVSKDADWLTSNNLRMNGLGNNYRNGKLESFGACDPIAEFAFQSVFICTGSPHWKIGPEFQQIVVGHEYFHAMSGDLAGDLGKKACCYSMSRMGPLGPEWLKEGGAQYAGLLGASDLGLINMLRELKNAAREVRGVKLDLAALNSRDGYNAIGRDKAAHVGVLASHALASRTGRKSIADYYRYLGYGVGHEDAFRSAFGLSIEEFQPMFEQIVTVLQR